MWCNIFEHQPLQPVPSVRRTLWRFLAWAVVWSCRRNIATQLQQLQQREGKRETTPGIAMSHAKTAKIVKREFRGNQSPVPPVLHMFHRQNSRSSSVAAQSHIRQAFVAWRSGILAQFLERRRNWKSVLSSFMDLESASFDSCPSLNSPSQSHANSQVLFEPTEEEIFAEPKGLRLDLWDAQLMCSNAIKNKHSSRIPSFENTWKAFRISILRCSDDFGIAHLKTPPRSQRSPARHGSRLIFLNTPLLPSEAAFSTQNWETEWETNKTSMKRARKDFSQATK